MPARITRADLRAQRRRIARTRSVVTTAVLALLVAALVPVTGQAAWAGAGSRVAGMVWADANSDGLRTADESPRGGVTVELLSGPTGPVVATTTTAANGSYAFTNVADGANYHVRVVAPGAFGLPDTADGENDFRRAEVPTTGNPERGIFGPVIITGATQATGIDAGLRPHATLVLDELDQDDACQGVASTGQAPWDASPGPGLDTTSADCIVRVGDTVQQNYSVATDVVRTGVTIPNVVVEFTIRPVSNPDDPGDAADSRLRLLGPQANGLPDGCLTAGVTPASAVTTAGDGTMTVVCNTGNASSTITTVALMWGFADDSPIPGFAQVTARAYAGQDDAAASNTVTGPVIEVTGTAEWDVKKSLQQAPTRSYRTYDGQSQLGFDVFYWVDVNNLRGDGGSELRWPVDFYDRMAAFPNARIHTCTPRRFDNLANTDWSVTCSTGSRQATNGDGSVRGWRITASKPRTSQWESTRIRVGVWVPVEDAYRTIDPGWQVGDQPPAGTVAWQNHITETDGWQLVGGQLNEPPGGAGPGFEPGWDGTSATGDNIVPGELTTSAPSWDLSKTLFQAAVFNERDTDNNPTTPAVPGFTVQYRFDFSEASGSLITPNLDTVRVNDVMPDYPGAQLLRCFEFNPQLGSASCETGTQPADGWEMNIAPAGSSDALKRYVWYAEIFVPTPTVPDPCRANVNDTLTFRNEARGTDGLTADGWLMNNSGLEPGWNGTTASGNNVSTYTFNVRSRVSNCGTLVGNKNFEGIPGGITDWRQFSPGDVVNSTVFTTASNSGVAVTNPILCDVFDVSVFRLSGDPLAGATGAFPNPHMEIDTTAGTTLNRSDYVIEYAIGSNSVDTQAGANERTLVNTPNVLDARGCREDDGPWSTDPAASFGTDWRDEINMVRLRPVDPTHVQTGPFTLSLNVPMQARWQYNGGPNAGEDIPAGIQHNNSGSWPERDASGQIVYDEISRQVSPNLPIDGSKWYVSRDASAWRDNTTVASGTQLRSWVRMAVDDAVGVGINPHALGVQAPGATDLRGFPIDNPTVCDVFDVSVMRMDGNATMTGSTSLVNQAAYVIEYAIGSNAVDTQAGPRSGGLFPVDSSSIKGDAAGCRDHDGPWQSDPATFGPDWRDQVNMVRVRPINPDHTEYAPFTLALDVPLQVRSFYNGGPNDGEAIATGVRLANEGGWSTGPRGNDWQTMEKEVRYEGMSLQVSKSAGAGSYTPGTDAIWNLSVGILNAAVGAVMENVQLVDTIPSGLDYNDQCTRSRLPEGVAVDYNAATRTVTFTLGDVEATAANYWIRSGATALQICTTVETIAQPGDTYVNSVTATSPSSENTPTATASTRASGTGQMGVVKNVDKPFAASGETYTWTMEWANTSNNIDFNATDIIDVLPWVGDGGAASQSPRGQFDSSYTGAAQLTGPLAQPTYVRGGTFTGAPTAGTNVPGTWYYSTLSPDLLNHDPRDASNANPQDADIRWRTAAEISDFGAVTAVRFVASGAIRTGQRVIANVPMVSTSNDLNNVYVNRAQIYSSTFPNQPLLSNEPYVLMPGFTLGDFVWLERNGNGRFDTGEQGAAGIDIEVLDEDGNVVATTATNAQGRWSVTGIPAGTYRVRIPAEMFHPGGPLEDFVVRTVGSGSSDRQNERADNNNTSTPNPAATGLVSTPVTLSYNYDAGRLAGANGPMGDDVAGLAPALIPDSFSTFTLDLVLMAAPGIDIEKHTNREDADEPRGPNIAVGRDTRWTYTVTNTGGTDLTAIEVTDDKVDSERIDCGSGSNIIAGPLAPGATFTCVADGTATAGQYENLGAVTALDPTATRVTDEDPSHYFGTAPEVDIEKYTNGQDADEETGPNITVGDDVRWTYEVTNTGNTTLTDVTVTDDKVAAADIDCGDGSNVVPGPIEPGDSFTCMATGSAAAGQYANMATVRGTAPATTDVNGDSVPGERVADDDPSHYFGVQSQVDIEKFTNGQDADEETGPLVPVGGAVRWTYVVTNTGNMPLTDVTVTDDVEAASSIDCADTGSNVVDGPLAPGESITCVAEGTATEGQYRNVGTVTATGVEPTNVDGETVEAPEVTDADPSHYFGIEPDVDIEKHTNGQDADESRGPNVTAGGDVTWTYVVTNVGNVPLTDLVVSDNVETSEILDCAATGSNTSAGPLAPGDSFTCVAHGIATAGQYANLGTVSALGPSTTDVDGESAPGAEVGDEDWSHYFGATPVATPEPPATTPPASDNGSDWLAYTGGAFGFMPIGAASALLGGGLLLVLWARRRPKGEHADDRHA